MPRANRFPLFPPLPRHLRNLHDANAMPFKEEPEPHQQCNIRRPIWDSVPDLPLPGPCYPWRNRSTSIHHEHLHIQTPSKVCTFKETKHLVCYLPTYLPSQAESVCLTTITYMGPWWPQLSSVRLGYMTATSCPIYYSIVHQHGHTRSMTPFACLSVVFVLGNIKCYLPLLLVLPGYHPAISNRHHQFNLHMQDILYCVMTWPPRRFPLRTGERIHDFFAPYLFHIRWFVYAVLDTTWRHQTLVEGSQKRTIDKTEATKSDQHPFHAFLRRNEMQLKGMGKMHSTLPCGVFTFESKPSRGSFTRQAETCFFPFTTCCDGI
ncbi:uncharacterized protein B0T23DRAFT_378467 [Neurospora hispaniola]|uniref:Uncharacterized protein n=1 Tax=Neurospora hispaniola TaxID=588809 RepID=A0AAJ0MTA8_9PEZI|nr:hypothetical protein B0T23DRAFT_378467 [Neurospora hispaniola]